MSFNSIDFLIFFPVVVIIYFIVPKRIRYIWLLIASYYFYMGWNPKYAILIAVSTVITYGTGLMIYKAQDFRLKKLWVALSLISNIGILVLFKYTDFLIDNFNKLSSYLGMSVVDRRMDLLLPVGISFYTFQALGYTFDVYKKDIVPEKNFLKYALYVSFFPQLVAGPIERSANLLPQIQNVENVQVWNFERIRDGFLLMAWGFFQKLVIADRASILVDNVINNYQGYGFLEISIAVVLFAVQIYCDFGGYTNIARGAAKVMGFTLMNNFRQPYLATNIKEFWRRWHISLTSWFTDYLYIPLGGSKKGLARKYLNILIVFGVSGLWHGADWSFVTWGGVHAIYQILGDMKLRICQKYSITIFERNSFSTKLRGMTGTFILTDFAWIFFVCGGMHHSLAVIRQMFTVFQTTDVFELGLDRGNWFFLLFGIVILTVVDVIHENGMSVFAIMSRQELWFRWTIYLALIWTIIMFGIYGIAYDTSSFIYFQF